MGTLTLQDVESAITAILRGGQRVVLTNGVSYDRANLSDLYNLRQRMQAETSINDTQGGMIVDVGFDRGGT